MLKIETETSTNMADLVQAQTNLLLNISKFYVNFKRSPKYRLTKKHIESRLKAVDACWSSFQQHHDEIITSTSEDERSGMQYFTARLYETCKIIYDEYKYKLNNYLKCKLQIIEVLQTHIENEDILKTKVDDVIACIQKSNTIKNLFCEICQVMLATVDEFGCHIMNCHPDLKAFDVDIKGVWAIILNSNRALICVHCNKKFEQQDLLDVHNAKTKHKCHICDIEFIKCSLLNSHINLSHDLTMLETNDEPPFDEKELYLDKELKDLISKFNYKMTNDLMIRLRDILAENNRTLPNSNKQTLLEDESLYEIDLFLNRKMNLECNSNGRCQMEYNLNRRKRLGNPNKRSRKELDSNKRMRLAEKLVSTLNKTTSLVEKKEQMNNFDFEVSQIKCIICKIPFNSNSELYIHQSEQHTVTSETPVRDVNLNKCFSCNISHPGSDETHFCLERKPEHSCTYCMAKFQTELMLKCHEKAYQLHGSYCSICSEPILMGCAKQECVGLEYYHCLICNSGFFTKRYALKHWTAKHGFDVKLCGSQMWKFEPKNEAVTLTPHELKVSNFVKSIMEDGCRSIKSIICCICQTVVFAARKAAFFKHLIEAHKDPAGFELLLKSRVVIIDNMKDISNKCKCFQCQVVFESKAALYDHFDGAHHKCSICFATFSKCNVLAAHINKLHVADVKTKELSNKDSNSCFKVPYLLHCDICGKKSRKAHSCKKIQLKNVKEEFRCKLCNSTGDTQQTHICKELPSRIKSDVSCDNIIYVFRCNVCGLAMDSTKVHKCNKVPAKSIRSKSQCTTCREFYVNSKEHSCKLRLKNGFHNCSDRPAAKSIKMKCKKCKVTYDKSKRHMCKNNVRICSLSVKSRNGDFVQTCSICDRSYSSEAELMNHLYSHTVSSNAAILDVQIDVCGDCNKTYVGDEFSHYCEARKAKFRCVACKMTFQTQLMLQCHTKAYKTLKRECIYCKRMFYKDCQLIKHNCLKITRPIWTHICRACGEGFKSKRKILMHLSDMHKVDAKRDLHMHCFQILNLGKNDYEADTVLQKQSVTRNGQINIITMPMGLDGDADADAEVCDTNSNGIIFKYVNDDDYNMESDEKRFIDIEISCESLSKVKFNLGFNKINHNLGSESKVDMSGHVNGGVAAVDGGSRINAMNEVICNK